MAPDALISAPVRKGSQARPRCGGTVHAEQSSLTRKVEHVKFAIPSREIGRLVVDAIRGSADFVLAQGGTRIADIDRSLPHQPNGSMLDTSVGEY